MENHRKKSFPIHDRLQTFTPSQTAKFQDLYPERRRLRHNLDSSSKSFFGGLRTMNGNASIVTRCQTNVDYCLETKPMVKHMISVLNSIGCPINPKRTFSCDICVTGKDIQYLGGYDDIYNQVFICANNVSDDGYTSGVMVRNLMHMFERCVNRIDFRNVDHLACMEIKKANLAHCTFFYSFFRKDGDYKLKRQHRTCVKNVAVDFLIKTKFVDSEIAKDAVDRVFDKCYRDLEPIGRRSSGKDQVKLAYEERYLFGYN